MVKRFLRGGGVLQDRQAFAKQKRKGESYREREQQKEKNDGMRALHGVLCSWSTQ